MGRITIKILMVSILVLSLGCTPEFYELSPDITTRPWSVGIAKKEYNSGRISRNEYKSIIYHIKSEYNYIASTAKSDYATGLITKEEYKKRVRAAKDAYNRTGISISTTTNKTTNPKDVQRDASPDVPEDDYISSNANDSEPELFDSLPEEPKETIKKKCINDFPNDYSLQASCAEKQARSWLSLNK